MKVVQINGSGYYGSTAKIVRQISAILDDNHIENTIVCSGYKEKSLDEKTICMSTPLSVKIHKALGFVFGDTGFHSKRATKKLIKYLKQEQPDIVHLHHLEGYFLHIEYLLRFLKEAKIKTVWTLHDCWSFTGHCTHFTAVKCQKWQTGCFACPQLKKYPYSLCLDRSKKLYNKKKALLEEWDDLHIVNVSRWMDENVGASFLKDRERKVIYNGLDINVFQPDDSGKALREKLQLDGQFIILGVASSWGEQKGLQRFIELSKKIPSNWSIVLVGLTPEQIMEMPKNIIGVTKIKNQEQLKSFYNMADVFVNLSLEETMGLVTVEAMACGTPAVVFNSTACPELLTPKVGEILYEQDIEYIVDVLKGIYDKGKSFYSVNCREHAVQNFSLQRMQQEYYNYYREIEGKV